MQIVLSLLLLIAYYDPKMRLLTLGISMRIYVLYSLNKKKINICVYVIGFSLQKKIPQLTSHKL